MFEYVGIPLLDQFLCVSLKKTMSLSVNLKICVQGSYSKKSFVR